MRSIRFGLMSIDEWSRGVLGSPHIDALECGGCGLRVGIVVSAGMKHKHNIITKDVIRTALLPEGNKYNSKRNWNANTQPIPIITDVWQTPSLVMDRLN